MLIFIYICKTHVTMLYFVWVDERDGPGEVPGEEDGWGGGGEEEEGGDGIRIPQVRISEKMSWDKMIFIYGKFLDSAYFPQNKL